MVAIMSEARPTAERYRVFLIGGVRAERSIDEVASSVADAFSVDRAEVVAALQTGAQLTLERGLTRADAERCVLAALDAGAKCRMVEVPASEREPEPKHAAPKEAREGEQAELAAYVGVNTEYYLERFAELADGNAIAFRPTWNLSAFLAPGVWALYRKMYLLAALVTLAGVPGVANLFVGLFGNYFYLKTIREEIARQRYSRPEGDITPQLAASGGVHAWVPPVAMAVFGVLGGLVLLGTVASVAIPSCVRSRPGPASEVTAEQGERGQFPGDSPESEGPPAARSLQSSAVRAQTMNKMLQLRTLLAVAELEQGALPATVDELEGVGESELTDGWGQRFVLEHAESGAAIRSSGPDRIAGTADDLVVDVARGTR